MLIKKNALIYKYRNKKLYNHIKYILKKKKKKRKKKKTF